MSDNNLSDLEQLLEDLGRPKSVAPSKKTRSSVVNLSELEALMTDLADSPAPAPKPTPAAQAPAPAPTKSVPAAKPARAAVSTSFEADDLDSIMDALNGDDFSGAQHAHHYEPAPVAVEVSPPKAAPKTSHRDSVNSTTTIDELEDLLNGLDVDTSSRSSVRANKPASSSGNSRLSVAAPRPAAPAASHNPYGSSNSSLNVAPRSNPAPAPFHQAAAPSHNNNNTYGANTNAYGSNTNAYGAGNNSYGAGNNAYGTNNNAYGNTNNTHGANAYGANNNAYGGNNANSRLNVAQPAARPSPSYSKPPPTTQPFVAKPAARPVGDNALDMLLGDLQSQLLATPDPSSPSTNGTCTACGKVILGEVITASGNRFHPEHFVCGNCQNPLGTASFYEQDGVYHCEKCYQELLCPRCGHCDEPILDRCVTAMGKKWHIDHFICNQCLHPFKNGSFFERDGRAFCEDCFANAFAPRCGGCSQPVNGPCINAVGQSWHPEHFVCQYCQKAFNGTFYEFGGKPYCDLHYHQQTGSLCAGCGKAVTGKCIDALGKKWHPEHFVCAFCMNALAAGSFTETNNKAYCKDCHGKLFG